MLTWHRAGLNHDRAEGLHLRCFARHACPVPILRVPAEDVVHPSLLQSSNPPT